MELSTKKDRFYQTLLENAFDGVHIVNAKGYITYINHHSVQFLGYMPEEAIGKSAQHFVYEEDIPKIREAFLEIIKNKRNFIFIEARFKHKNGQILTFLGKIVNLLDNPDIQGFVINYQDVSEQKKITLRLQETQNNLQAIMTNTLHSLVLIDQNLEIMYINQAGEKLVKKLWKKKPRVGEMIIDFVVPSNRENFKNSFLRCLNNEYIQYEAIVEVPDNEPFWIEAVYSPVYDQNHNIYAVAFSGLDITARKLAETKSRQNEKIYRLIAENTPKSSINIYNRDYEILFTEGKIYDYFPLKREYFLGKNLRELFSPRTVELYTSYFERSFAGEVCNFEFHNHLGHFLLNTMPLTEDNGEIKKILVIFQDISDIKANEIELRSLNQALLEKQEQLLQQNQNLIIKEEELASANEELISQQEDLRQINEMLVQRNEELTQREAQLQLANQQILAQRESITIALERLKDVNQALLEQEEQLKTFNEQLINQQEDLKITLEELSERNFELDQIVYRTSHDIRSPLASVLGLVNIIKLEGVPDHLQAYIHLIGESIQKLERFANSMLDFAKSNRIEKKVEVIDFEQIIQKCFSDFRYMPNFERIEKKIDFHFDKNVVFKSDIQKLEIIFGNLISNAIKYMNPMEEDNFLLIEISINPVQAEIIFRDNGIGIRKDYINKIFDMFVRATDRGEGSGLGLYIVKQTVEKLNGKIDLQSHLGEGTEFKIFLPNT